MEIRGQFPANLHRFGVASTRFAAHKTAFSLSQTGEAGQLSGNRMLILGMGFVGRFVARELNNEGWAVSGTCRSVKRVEELGNSGFDVCLFDANVPDQRTMKELRCCTHLLVSIPPVVGIGDPMLQHGELLRNVLMDSKLKWLGYLSSTSVYGDCGGAYVDEDHPTSPKNELAKLRLVAEEGWLKLGDDVTISAQAFRLGGIYGPGRSAIDTIIKQGPLSQGQKMRISKRYTSRVHVEDICQAVKASMDRLSCRRIYNLVDDDPAPREEVFAYTLDLVEKKWSGLIERSAYIHVAESVMQKGNSRGEKRVSNARMKKELGVQLLHPSYISGIESIIDQMEHPFQFMPH